MSTAHAFLTFVLSLSGDFESKLQFTGAFNAELKAEHMDFSKNKNCDISSWFQEVYLKEKTRNEKFLKIKLKFICEGKSHTLPAQFVRLSDLSFKSNVISVDDKFKLIKLKADEYNVSAISKKK